MSKGTPRPSGGCFSDIDVGMGWQEDTMAIQPVLECADFSVSNISELFRQLAIELQLCEEDQENYHHRENEQGEFQFMLRIMSKDKIWNIRRSYDNFCMLDKQLHKCIFDRRFSHLPELASHDDLSDVSETEMQELLQKYLKRFSSIAGSMIYCGSILNWLEMDNRGNRLLAVDDSGINTPAIAAAHAIRRYNAQAADEISLEVGDIVSVIDKPPPEDTIWWRGKRGFEVGFFPSECVELIGDKVPQSMASRIPPSARKPSSGPVKRGSTWNEGASSSASTTNPSSDTVLRKHSKLISFLQRFFFTRPARNQLKRSGIVKERVFGCDLGEHLLNSGHDVPLVLKCCAEVIEKHGITDGIYRLSGINSNIQKLRLAFDEDRVPDLTDETYLQDIHSISSLLKMYFRELPNPLLTYQLYDKFAKAVQDEDKLHLIHDVVQQLPPPHYRTTEYLIRHLARVAAYGSETGMHSKNLAIVWAPNLLRSKELELGGGVAALQGVSIQAVVTEFLICYADLIFSDKMPSYSSPELRQSQKKPRPKSLAISTPTRLLTLEEARERVLSSHNVPAQKYIDVGGGPEKLPPMYHTVLDLPGYKKKSRESGSMTTLVKPKKSPVSGWKSFFSKSRSSSIKQKTRKSSLQGLMYDTDGGSSICTIKAITEEDVHNWKKRRLRSAKSAESLLSLSSHKNSISSSSSNPRGLSESGIVVNLYTGENRGRIRQHKRSLSSDASTVLLHQHGLLPFHDCTNSDVSRATAVDINALPQRNDNDEDSSISSDNDSDNDNGAPQLQDIHGQTRQSFIRGDSTRRAISYRKTSSAPSTPQQQNRQVMSETQNICDGLSKTTLRNESNSDKSDDDCSDEQGLYKTKVVKSVEFSQSFDVVNSYLTSKSEDSLCKSSRMEKELNFEFPHPGNSESHMVHHITQVLNNGQRQAYYSRFHDYAEIDESQISAPRSVVEKTSRECAMKKEQKEAELKAKRLSVHSSLPNDGKAQASTESSPENTKQLRSDLLSAIAKLEDSISPINYMQKEMSKCLSVPSDIGKSLENVNLGSQSDLMSGVSISELSQSVDSISVNDSMDLDLTTFAVNSSLYTDSAKTLDICKEINKAFSSCNRITVESQEKGIRKSTSDIPNFVDEQENQSTSDSKTSRFKQGSKSLDEKTTNYTQVSNESSEEKTVEDQLGQLTHLSSSVSDNCVRQENKAKMEPTKRYSHHIMDDPKPESVNPLFIVESPPSLESLNSFTQMLKFYAPDEVEHMLAESSDYWSHHYDGSASDKETCSKPQKSNSNLSCKLPLPDVYKYDQLSPIEIDTTNFGSKEHTPVSSSSTICKSPIPWSTKDLDTLDDSAGKNKSDTSICKSSSASSLEGISKKSPWSESLGDTIENEIMIRSWPPETGTIIKSENPELISSLSINKTHSDGTIQFPESQKMQLTSETGCRFEKDVSNSSKITETLSVGQWESMEVKPSLDSTLIISPRAVITTSHSDSEFTTHALNPDQINFESLSEKDSCETLISSPPSPFSIKNYQYLYGNIQSCSGRPPQSCIADLDSIMNMSKEEISNAERIILSEKDKCQNNTNIKQDKKVPLASPEISIVSEERDFNSSSDFKNLDFKSQQEASRNCCSLKKSHTDSALQHSQKKPPSRSQILDSQLSSNKPSGEPISPIKSPSQKDGIEKLRRSFIADHMEFVSQNSRSRKNEKQQIQTEESNKDVNKFAKEEVNHTTLTDSKKYTSSPAISQVLIDIKEGSYCLTETKSRSVQHTSLDSHHYQISPPEEDVLIQIRPTLKRPSSPRRRLIEKMKKDAQCHEQIVKSHEDFTAAIVPSSTQLAAEESSKQPYSSGKTSQFSPTHTTSEVTPDFLKTRSLDSLLPNLKMELGEQVNSSKEKDTFRWVMASNSSDIPQGHNKASSGTATSSDLEVVQDIEMADSVFADDVIVDIREHKKESHAGKKCASNINKNIVDNSSNRSSLDESILQVAAERHNAFEVIGKSLSGTQQYDTGSLRHPKAKKLQNLKDFFEHEEMKNRPSYARSRSTPSKQNSPTCPRYQKQCKEEVGKKKEPSKKESVSPSSRIMQNSHHRSRSREREDTRQSDSQRRDSNNHSRSPTPTGRKPAALEKWQRAESHERDGKQTWEMGVDYVHSKGSKSKPDHSTTSAAAKPPPHCSSPRMRTWSESSTSDADIKSPSSHRAKDDRQKHSSSVEYSKSMRTLEQSKSDVSDSEYKLSFSEMEIIGEVQLPRRKRKGSIKELRNYFEAKQVTGNEQKGSSSNNGSSVSNSTATSTNTISTVTTTISNTKTVATVSTSLTTESLLASPHRVPRSRVKSLSPVCGQSDLKSDDELLHKGTGRFSLDFSGYTSRPHVEGIVRPQPVRLGPKPFYGAKT